MTNDDPVLIELRKISAWADLQRKVTRWSLAGGAVFLLAVLIFAYVIVHPLKDDSSNDTPEIQTVYMVDRNVRIGEFDEAIRLGEVLVQRAPLYPDAHRKLAAAYLAKGNIEKARAHYAETARLLPSEENERLLAAIDKRISAERSQAHGTEGDSAGR